LTVRTRFAPSPTGYLHLGGARTALFAWLYARHHKGEFILRIEDTDRERSTDESVQAILDGMEWLGLDYDEGPFYQTRRMDRYQEIIQQLLDNDQAYYCYCSKEELDALRAEQMKNKEKPRYDGRYRDFTGTPPDGVNPVIRFKNPQSGDVVFDDLVKGEIKVSNAELDDLIIARSDGTPTYNLTVVVDDLDMQISHVIRGDDHVNNTPRQINIFKALGAPVPEFAHLPMILGEDGQRLSKRHGAVSVMQYPEQGFLPEALLNYLVRLGWSHGDQEVFSVPEMIDLFALKDVNRAASSFNSEKLLWLNEQYIKSLPAKALAESVARKIDYSTDGESDLEDVVDALRDRCKTLNEFAETCRYFFHAPEAYDDKAQKKAFGEQTPAIFEQLISVFKEADWQADSLGAVVKQVAADQDVGMGKVGMPLRVALTGNTNSPDIGVTLALIGRKAVIERLENASKLLETG